MPPGDTNYGAIPADAVNLFHESDQIDVQCVFLFLPTAAETQFAIIGSNAIIIGATALKDVVAISLVREFRSDGRTSALKFGTNFRVDGALMADFCCTAVRVLSKTRRLARCLRPSSRNDCLIN